MKFTKIHLQNWKNFQEVEVDLPERAFLIGPNASGKSNFLDVFRFLRDISTPGGIQQAVQDRGGISKLRCLHARNPSDIAIRVDLADDQNHWSYSVVFSQQGKLPRQGAALVKKEVVIHNSEVVLNRPDKDDKDDERLLEQTALEQISRNRSFRPIVDHFQQVSYLHLVPQMIRGGKGMSSESNFPDVYGGRFLEIVASTTEAKRKRYLKKIEEVLKIAVPQLTALKLTTDKGGVPHLEATYEHWRAQGASQDESQFSDGTLRLIGLLWMLQDGAGLVLIEEPELSLHQAIVRQLAPFIHRAQTRSKTTRQAFISTHSVDLLSDPGIGAEEILLFDPTAAGTTITVGGAFQDLRDLMAQGLTAAEVALPRTHPADAAQMSLFAL